MKLKWRRTKAGWSSQTVEGVQYRISKKQLSFYRHSYHIYIYVVGTGDNWDLDAKYDSLPKTKDAAVETRKSLWANVRTAAKEAVAQEAVAQEEHKKQ